MSHTKTIDTALQQLRAKGATTREVEKARDLLAWLAENNRSDATVKIGRGVSVQLPKNELGRGIRSRAIEI